MAKTKISEFNSNPALNTDIDSINIAEGCAPSGINDAIRELMSQLKDWQAGTSNDPYVVGSTGSLTLNQGTANGVAYLNGSKVVTSGSALTFDGTNLGIGATSPARPLDVRGSLGMQVNEDSVGTKVISIRSNFAGAGPAINVTTNDPLLFLTNNTEQMRLTSTGLGIGTSSPAYKLDVNRGSSGVVARFTGGGAASYIYADSSQVYYGSAAGVPNCLILNEGSNYLAFNTNGSEKMRLDTSGNLGLGVTPSAWANSKAFDIGGYGALSTDTLNDANTSLSWNSYATAYNAWKYKNTGSAASRYTQEAAKHVWYNAPSGTAGNAITFTQAMTLDASGNLVLGATSASQRLEVVSSVSPFARFRSTASAFTGVDIGQNSAGAGVIDVRDNQPLILYTNDTERARIDSSGNLLVGQTSTGIANATSYAFQLDGQGIRNNHGSGTPSGYAYMQFGYAGSSIGSITQNGTTAVAYNTSSDYRLKNTIAPMTGALARIAALKPCTYKWNADGSDGEGFIAHELAEVVPNAVTGTKDAVDEEGNPKYQGIDTSFLVATLTAAIQEQQAIIESLTARLDAANL